MYTVSISEKGHRLLHKVDVVPQLLEFVFSGARSGLSSESRISHQELLGHRSIIFISLPLLFQCLPEAKVTEKTLVKIALVVFCSVNIPQEKKILN